MRGETNPLGQLEFCFFFKIPWKEIKEHPSLIFLTLASWATRASSVATLISGTVSERDRESRIRPSWSNLQPPIADFWYQSSIRRDTSIFERLFETTRCGFRYGWPLLYPYFEIREWYTIVKPSGSYLARNMDNSYPEPFSSCCHLVSSFTQHRFRIDRPVFDTRISHLRGCKSIRRGALHPFWCSELLHHLRRWWAYATESGLMPSHLYAI